MTYDASPVKNRQIIKIQALRWQYGKKPGNRPLRRQCSQKSLKPGNQFKTLRPVITLRPKHGYSATKYDASAAKTQKTLRRQFGHSYEVKKVRNTSSRSQDRDAD
jgi:hypothetical protein